MNWYNDMSNTSDIADIADISFNHTRGFTTWMVANDCTLVVSCYRKNKLFCIGLQGNGEVSTYFCNMLRPMGMALFNNELYISNIGNIHKYINFSEEYHPEWGYFDSNYYIQASWHCGDNDVHDLTVNKSDTIYYVSALFNCVCKNSTTHSFEVYWTPPWITLNENGKPPAEDRCHLNGLCSVDGKPRFVTAACTYDYFGAWREQHGDGVVYDIENEEFVATRMWAPHSPRWYNDRLWVAEAGTGHFGYVDFDKKEFIPKKFIPGFIRGITFINNYAVICTSFDRHDYAFKDIPLGHIMERKGVQPHAGLTIIDINTFDIKERFEFLDPKTELYDVVCITGTKRSRIIDPSEDIRNVFHL